MKNTTIFLILIILFSCNSTKTDYQKRIDLFENHIGLENANGLTQLTNEFEKFLTYKYPNETIDSAYTFFLRAINSGFLTFQEIGINKEWERRLLKVKEQTTLENEIYEFVDSVWIEGNEIKYTSSYRGEDTLRSGDGAIFMSIEDNEDSILEYMEQLKESREYHLFGKYHTGLELVMEQDSVIISYYDAKNAAGSLSPRIFSKGFLYLNPDFSDYFHKRIYIIEMFY